MYTIVKQGNKIKYLTIEGIDIEMMEYSDNPILYRLYNFCHEECSEKIDEIIIPNNNEQNKLEIQSIIKSYWLINKDELTEENAIQKMILTDISLEDIERLLSNSEMGRSISDYLRNQWNLNMYLKFQLEDYLKELAANKFKENRTRKLTTRIDK